MPTNIADSLSPLNQETSENMSDKKAASMSSKSEVVNFLNMNFKFFLFSFLTIIYLIKF